MLRKLCAAAIAFVALSLVASWAMPANAEGITDFSAKKKRWVRLDEVAINVTMTKEVAPTRRKYSRAYIRAKAAKRARAAKAKAAAKLEKARRAASTPPPVRSAFRPAVSLTFADIMDATLRTLTPMTEEFAEQLSRQAMEITRARELAEARAYIVRTATPGGTMSRDGVANNVRKFHPELVLRLAPAIREARANGLPNAGVYSGYRAPGWGVGGFADKFNSLHGVGMAVDMTGIGKRGSAESVKWFAIAGQHSIFNPYGPFHWAEHNHYQITMTKMVARGMPLRATITAKGPIDLERMWKVATSIVRYEPYVGPPPSARRRYARRHHHSRVAKHHHPSHNHAQFASAH